jgi:subtilase-type serine protease
MLIHIITRPRLSRLIFLPAILVALNGCVPSVNTLIVTTTASNPACDGSGVTSSSGAFSVGGTGGCITSVSSSLESEANTIRNSSQYQIQTYHHSVSGSNVLSNSLIAGRFEYAHALDLTGAEQVIAIHDHGFNPAHNEFIGKPIVYGNGKDASTISVDAHGTAVGSLASGSAMWGNTVGGAPNATLYLSSWLDGSDENSVQEAETINAVVLNNSWGYQCTSEAYGDCGINDHSISFLSNSHRSALLNYAGDEGIVVFSASNEEAQTQATFMAALPHRIPALEEGWLAVINVARDYDTSIASLFDDTNVGLMSSGCLEAARWCVAADGTSYVATATPTLYEYGTGTSYAAPRVSAAIAILAEAFPNLTPSEIRNRLLLTADNAFFAADTSQIQTLNFSGGLSHDYHWIYGHGFIDLKDALLPIGGATTTSKSGTISLSAPIVFAGGASGDAVQTALKKITLHATDLAGGDFSARGTALVSTSQSAGHQKLALAEFSDKSDRNSVDVLRTLFTVSPFESGSAIRVPFALNESITTEIRLPSSARDSSGLRVAKTINTSSSALEFGISGLADNASLLGLSLGENGQIKSSHLAIDASLTTDLSATTSLTLNGNQGRATTDVSGVFDGIDAVNYGSLGAKLTHSGTFTQGDHFSLFALQPTAIYSGSAHASLQLADGSASPGLAHVEIPLAPSQKELEIGFEYIAQGLGGEEWMLRASRQINASNIGGNDVDSIMFGVRRQF